MFFFAHLAAGLIIGKFTGNYPLAIFGAVIWDIDHLYAYARSGTLHNWRKLLRMMTTQHDPLGNQRNLFHSLIAWAVISSLVVLWDHGAGMILGAAYLSHLFLDAVDGADFYPFFPNRRWNLKGPIPYFSKWEFGFTAMLILIFVLL